ncbi:hypothetical protein NDU88_006137 [Pleurodeles waltl]|uniref:Uncharacterized protein n=1 Tax=Pleurodeles waltl TaxID=8319 RepID=A0AAV7LW25_PLEWA|nr:hypothetical protein NDU88_006137 [Pleurodeles waltl]
MLHYACAPARQAGSCDLRNENTPLLSLWMRLMTPRPICNEDGRDVRGRRGVKAEARTKRGVVAGRLLVGLIS